MVALYFRMPPSTKLNQVQWKVIWFLLSIQLQCDQFILVIVILCKFWKYKNERKNSWANGPFSIYDDEETAKMEISPLRSSEFSLSECTSHDITSLIFFILKDIFQRCAESLFSQLWVVMGKCFSAYLNAYEIDFLFGVMIFNNER